MKWINIVFLLWGGFVAGVFAGALIRDIGMGYKIDDCRREHNIYACELQAVPVAQPSWVSNGESK